MQSVAVLPSPSPEQQSIIDTFKSGKNIIVEAVAGSGKTTTSLHCCNAIKDQNSKILIVTYNARLKQETRNKVMALGITNVEVHSYHALVTKYYGDARTDLALRQLIRTGKPRRILKADIIIIDETQDMSLDYYMLICKLIKDRGNGKHQFMIIGDPRQMIFNIGNTSSVDSRFLTYSHELYHEFTKEKGEWVRLPLSVSYRLTDHVTKFINQHVLNIDLIKGGNLKNLSVRPDYYICDTFNCSRIIIDHIKQYGTDLCLLSPSIRNERSPIMKTINALSSQGYKFYVSNDDTADNDNYEDVMKGKILVSSFHQMKGCERRAVIVFGFDDTYFDFFARNETKCICPNAMYVALTRAKEKLSVLHHYMNKSFRTLRMESLSQYVNLHEIKSLKIKNDSIIVYKKDSYSVTDLLRHSGVLTMERALSLIDVSNLNLYSNGTLLQGTVIPLPDTSVKIMNYSELVSDFYGTVIPIIFEYLKQEQSSVIENILKIRVINNHTQKNDMFDIQEKEYSDLYQKIKDQLSKIKSSYEIGEVSAEQWMRIAVIFNGLESGYFHRIYQIADYQWINEDYIMQNVNRLLEKFKTMKTQHEVKIIRQIGETVIYGRVDLLEIPVSNVNDKSIIWELKCKTECSNEDILQLATYMALQSSNVGYLYYVNTDTMFSVKFKHVDENIYIQFLDILLNGKKSAVDITDESFLMNVTKARTGLLSCQTESVNDTNDLQFNDILNNDQDSDPGNDLDTCML